MHSGLLPILGTVHASILVCHSALAARDRRVGAGHDHRPAVGAGRGIDQVDRRLLHQGG